jgi:acetolactate synthase-1/2/3 large subunit
MRVCDWIADYLKSIGVERVHGLMGGGAAGLNDGFIKQQMPYICYHHEQGAGHAAVAESKFTGRLAVVNPTTGCAGTNCATSVLNAWQDSVPVLFISGNVRKDTCSGWINETKGLNIRKYGIQEHHIVDTYRSMTKMAKFITSADEVAYTIQEAVWLATSGRPGPVWIDIPGDIQLAKMPEEYSTFTPSPSFVYDKYLEVRQAIERAERPLILAGYGIRQSGTVEDFVKFIEKWNIPFVSTYGARDYTANDHRLSIGAVGQRGSRAGNFALQNADLLLILGSSLNASVVGYDPKQFAPAAKKIVVDYDLSELNKDIVKIDKKVPVQLTEFFVGMEL